MSKHDLQKNKQKIELKSFSSFNEWEKEYFTETARAEIIQKLNLDTEKLAIALANSTFDKIKDRRAQ